VFHWATVCKMLRPMLSNRCLSCPVCLSVMLVCYGQMVGWIKMKLGVQVGLGPGHIVLDGDPARPPPKGQSPPICGPYLLRPNGCRDQDATWYGGTPQPRRVFVRWGPRSPLPNRGQSPTIFGPFIFVTKRLDASRCHLLWR